MTVVEHTGMEAAPHLTCVGSTRAHVAALLERYREAGVKRIVALRGDLPATAMSASAPGEFHYANELVSFIRETHGDAFKIEVAAYPEMHPQAASPAADFENFRRKVEAGADAALTQLFYNADAYFDFMERCAKAGIKIPVVPGIMPITGYANMVRFCDGLRRRPAALGASAPGRAGGRQARAARFRARRGHAPLRDAAAQRRAGTALLHHQPGRPDAAPLGESRVAAELARQLPVFSLQFVVLRSQFAAKNQRRLQTDEHARHSFTETHKV